MRACFGDGGALNAKRKIFIHIFLDCFSFNFSSHSEYDWLGKCRDADDAERS